MLVDFPTILRPRAGGYAPFVRSLSGGQAIDGTEQVQPQRHDRWAADFEFFVRAEAELLALRAFVTSMGGRVHSCLLPTFERRAPWEIDQYGIVRDAAWARTRDLDGTIYADAADLIDSLIVAKVNAAVAMNATSVAINITKGSAPTPGMQFSIDNRLYAIKGVQSAGSVHTCSVWPWLRSDVAINTAVNFTWPKCEMRFASDGEGQEAFSGLTARRYGAVRLRFDETSVSS